MVQMKQASDLESMINIAKKTLDVIKEVNQEK
jgi:hypothetical protein